MPCLICLLILLLIGLFVPFGWLIVTGVIAAPLAFIGEHADWLVPVAIVFAVLYVIGSLAPDEDKKGNNQKTEPEKPDASVGFCGQPEHGFSKSWGYKQPSKKGGPAPKNRWLD